MDNKKQPDPAAPGQQPPPAADKRDDSALIELVASMVRAAGETQDPRIADLAIVAVESIKGQPGIFEALLLKCTAPTPQPPYQNPMLGQAVAQFTQR